MREKRYVRVCRDCENRFETEHKKGKVCDICKKKNGKIIIVGINVESKEERYERAQKIASKVYKEHHGDKKANLWVCHRLMPDDEPLFEKGRCFLCGESISYDQSLAKNMSKNAKKICRECICSNKEYTQDMSDDEKKILGVR